MAETSDKSKHRVVKKVDSVRVAAEKVQGKAPKKPGVIRLALHYVAVPFRWIAKPFKRLGKLKPFRILGYILWPTYFRNSFKELRQVTWPNRRESLQLTSAVLIFAAIFGVMIALVDFGLDKLFKQVLLK